ncbi:hypothetical protein [Mycolicibacterium conceptionense]|uniref:hypothetical protein n=1 Tax=Mycolicibacterium conceptionense TaxID=451644 RepID=UPI003204E71C
MSSAPSSRSSDQGTGSRPKVLRVAAAVTLALTAALGMVVVARIHQNPGSPSSLASNVPSVTTPPRGWEAVHATNEAHERACESVLVIEDLTQDSLDTVADTGQPKRPVYGHQLIAYGNALNHTGRKALPATMSAAVTSYSYALANLGAMINHRSTTSDISSMEAVVTATGTALQEFCLGYRFCSAPVKPRQEKDMYPILTAAEASHAEFRSTW